MSVSTRCLYSVSEISIPAMNEPSARLRPASSVNHASPKVISNRFSTNSSSLLRRAISVNHQRMMRCPPASSRKITRAALSPATARVIINCSADAPERGISTNRGTTAKSWNSSSQYAFAVLRLHFQPHHAHQLPTMAVLLHEPRRPTGPPRFANSCPSAGGRSPRPIT